MSDCYVGEIRMFGGNYAPEGWLLCAGQTLPISQYDVLFSLLGTRYGGDGVNTFCLPDLRGRVPLGQGNGGGLTPRSTGDKLGTETVAVQANQTSHGHTVTVSANDGTTSNATGKVLGKVTGGANLYRTDATASVAMGASTVTSAGQGQGHENMMPSLAINFIIAWDGIYPSRP